MLFGFGPYKLDLAICELRRGAEAIALQPRAFGTLRYLVENRERVVGKQELIDSLWGGKQVNNVAVPWTINRVRKALGDGLEGQTYIETVRGHGYRFVGDVDVLSSLARPPAYFDSARPPSTPAASLPAPSDATALDAPVQRLALAGEPPFVGREGVMAQLLAGLELAERGQGALFLLTGEAGIGKTRCTSELALLSARRGQRVWLGRCLQSSMAPAFWPFVQVLRAACDDPSLDDALRREGEALLREFEPHTRGSTSPEQATPTEDTRFWLLDKLSRWFVDSARTALRVIELDDLHNIDESSLQALALLSPLLAQARLLVVATARDHESMAAGSSASYLVGRLRPCVQVPLPALRAEDVEAYLTVALGPEQAALWATPLAVRTAGNPLFLQEISRVVRARYDHAGSVGVEDVRLPDAVREIISARFLAMDSRARSLLDAGSVLRNELTVPTLQRVTGLGAEDVLAGLDAAIQANILELRSDGSTFGFVHPLFSEVLYERLTADRRANLHASAGRALEATSRFQPALHELAYHFHHAPLEPYYEAAARYGRLAGDASMRVLAYEEALEYYGWALEAQTHVPLSTAEDACDLLLLSGAALAMAGRLAQARKRCERAIELSREAKLPELLIRAAQQLRPTVWVAQIPDPLAVRALQDALAMLPETAIAARSRATGQLANLPPCSLNLQASRQMSNEALRLARSTHDITLVLIAQRARLFALSGADTIDEQLRTADEILRNDPESASRFRADALFASYHALLKRGDETGADRALEAFEHCGRELRLLFVTWHADRLRIQSALSAGRLDEAERQFDDLFARGEQLRVPLSFAYRAALLQTLSWERTGKRHPQIDHEMAVEAAWFLRLPEFRSRRVYLALERGEVEAARRDFASLAENDFEAILGSAYSLIALVSLSAAACMLDERAGALALRGRLEPYADQIALGPFTFSHGCVARYVGRLERCLGRVAQARSYFERAIEGNARAGLELERLRSIVDLGDLLGQSRSADERERGLGLLTEAKETATRLGAHGLVNRACEAESTARARRAELPAPARTASSAGRPSAKTARRRTAD